ncbi:MAG: hypothetical protein ABFR75_03750 [Acidobacteriota bacterium]
MKKTIVLVMVLFIMLVSGTTLESKGKPYMSKHMMHGQRSAERNLFRGNYLLRFKDEIGLTADQVSKIEKMNITFQESVIKRMADVKVKELKLANYLRSDKVKRSTAEKMVREVAKLKTDMQVDRIHYMLDIKDVLTPEQEKKIESFRRRMANNKRKGDFRKNLKNRPKRR